MTIQEQLFALLSNATPAAERVYPLIAPDAVARPYVIFQRVSANTENILYGSSGLINTRIQLDVYATTYAQAQDIAAAIDGLMAAWNVQNVSVLSQDFYEPDAKLHRASIDYSIWHP
ncbi:Protein of unknown function [Collimonas sp. OK607]|uniref:tail completion protein gp17 n=1 Tax=Collimonas sp. OK607 TaxID=1798194 RepID=UPI0008E2F28F|nr:DUF3168 domain-containing protein [Collimonas sp. OK607]SFB02710.1 Protein of unknown function [Collimonas sp. OK607]